MNALDELRHAVRWTERSLDFDVDVRAHVFELTIRSLGGLLSAHSLLARDPSLVPGLSQTPLTVTMSHSHMCHVDSATVQGSDIICLSAVSLPADICSRLAEAHYVERQCHCDLVLTRLPWPYSVEFTAVPS